MCSTECVSISVMNSFFLNDLSFIIILHTDICVVRVCILGGIMVEFCVPGHIEFVT